MRAIPAEIKDPKVRTRLEQLAREIDEKMKRVNTIRDKMKKKEFTPAEMQELKKLGGEIDQFDKEWKSLVAGS